MKRKSLVTILFLILLTVASETVAESNNVDVNTGIEERNAPQKLLNSQDKIENDDNSDKNNESIIARTKAEIKAEIYKEAIESYRRELDNWKWVITIALTALGIIIAMWGVIITIIAGIRAKESRISAQESAKERSITELWTEASIAYSAEDYRKAAMMWEEVHNKYHPESRQLFNNWGSSLLNWARQLNNSDPKRNILLEDAINKYKEAEKFTEGIAAYNLACAYALLGKEEDCQKYLLLAIDKGRIVPRQQFEDESDFKIYRGKPWYNMVLDRL